MSKGSKRPIEKWLVDSGTCVSYGEARRLIKAGVVEQEGKVLEVGEMADTPTLKPIKVGKHRIIDGHADGSNFKSRGN